MDECSVCKKNIGKEKKIFKGKKKEKTIALVFFLLIIRLMSGESSNMDLSIEIVAHQT